MATNIWTGAAGDNNWNTAGNWSLGVVPAAGEDIQIGPGVTATIQNGATASLDGNIDNQGTIALGSAGGAGATLTIGGGADSTVTLAGGGVFLLNTPNDIISNVSATGTAYTGITLDNQETIEGAGAILSFPVISSTGIEEMGLSLLNDTTGIIDATGANGLSISDMSVTNTGLLEASGAGGLQLGDVTVTNTGVIEALNGSQVDLELGADIAGGTLTTVGTGVIQSNASPANLTTYTLIPTLDGSASPVTITAGSTVQVDDGDALMILGSIVNQGEIALDASASATGLIVDGTVTLSGPGSVILSDNAGNGIYSDASGSVLDNQQTISGAGSIFTQPLSNGTLSLINDTMGIIDATGVNGLSISTNVTNKGLLEASGAGGLQLTNLTVANSGVIEALNGSHVDLNVGTDIVGGSLTTEGTGVIAVKAPEVTLDGSSAPVTITTGSTVEVGDGATSTFLGSIVNDGTLALNSTGDLSTIDLNGPVTLSGSGSLVLSNNANNQINSDSDSTVFDNQETISGAGLISVDRMTNDTTGIIDANDSAPLTISGLLGLINNGILEASNGGTLVVPGGTSGSGQLLIQANSEINLGGFISNNLISIVNGLTINFGLITTETVSFNGADGTLKLDGYDPFSFSGQGAITLPTIISGFAVGDTLDIMNTATSTFATPTADGPNTTLTVSLDASAGAFDLAYTLAGNYTADTFTVTQAGADALITLNDPNAPVLGGAGNTAVYTPGGGAEPVDAGLTITDSNSASLTGATIAFNSSFLAGDQLNFVNQNGITGNYNAATGKLTLSGSASLAAYQAALDSVTYSSTSANPTRYGADPARTVIWTVNSGADTSTPATSTISFASSGASAKTSSIAASLAALAADGVSTTTLTVAVDDSSGDPIAGQAVTLSSTDPGDIFGAPSGVTNAAGVFTTTLASTQAAVDTITATEGALQETTSVTFESNTPTNVFWTDGSDNWTTASDWSGGATPGVADNVTGAGRRSS